jgi:hypothetical protein
MATHASFLKRYWPWLAVGAAAAGGTAYYFATKTPAAPAPPPPLPPGVTGVTLQPGAQTLNLHLGLPLQISLPYGAAWQSATSPGGAAFTVSGATPITVKINTSGTITAVYTDINGNTQNASLVVTAT